MEKFRRTTLKYIPVKEFIEREMKMNGHSRKAAKFLYNAIKDDEIWVNDLYQVNIARDRLVPKEPGGPEFVHLSIKRLDKKAVHDWRHFQQIKNELVGPEHEGVEIYPAESRLVDQANQYHIWCLAQEGARLPIGWTTRTVDYDPPEGSGVTQRPEGEEL